AQSRGFEPMRRKEFVDADFEGSRRVEHCPAAFVQPVQQVHAKHNLLQRPRRHGADDDGISAVKRPRSSAHASTQSAEVEQTSGVTAAARRALEVANVPTSSAGKNDNVHAIHSIRSESERTPQYIGIGLPKSLNATAAQVAKHN